MMGFIMISEEIDFDALMFETVSRRKKVFSTDPKDQNYNYPISKLNKDYSKSFVFYLMELKSIFKVGRKRVFKLQY